MKSSILLLAFTVFAFFSCTTAYKTGQTPDDLYYSAAKPQDENVRDENKREDDRSSYDDEYYDDRYLRMKVRNRYQWSNLNDWYYYDKYSYRYNYYFGTYYNPFNTWNYVYNPFCCCQHSGWAVINPKIPASPPLIKRYFSLGGYTNTVYGNTNGTGAYKVPVRTGTQPVYNNSNNSGGLSNKIKTIFSNNNSGNGSSRTYSPSTSSGSGNSGGSTGGGSGKSGGGNVSRPVRN